MDEGFSLFLFDRLDRLARRDFWGY